MQNNLKQVKNQQCVQQTLEGRKEAFELTTIILGSIGLVAWLFPLCGLPVGTFGSMFGALALFRGKSVTAIVGTILSAMCFVASLINVIVSIHSQFGDFSSRFAELSGLLSW